MDQDKIIAPVELKEITEDEDALKTLGISEEEFNESVDSSIKKATIRESINSGKFNIDKFNEIKKLIGFSSGVSDADKDDFNKLCDILIEISESDKTADELTVGMFDKLPESFKRNIRNERNKAKRGLVVDIKKEKEELDQVAYYICINIVQQVEMDNIFSEYQSDISGIEYLQGQDEFTMSINLSALYIKESLNKFKQIEEKIPEMEASHIDKDKIEEVKEVIEIIRSCSKYETIKHKVYNKPSIIDELYRDFSKKDGVKTFEKMCTKFANKFKSNTKMEIKNPSNIVKFLRTIDLQYDGIDYMVFVALLIKSFKNIDIYKSTDKLTVSFSLSYPYILSLNREGNEELYDSTRERLVNILNYIKNSR